MLTFILTEQLVSLIVVTAVFAASDLANGGRFSGFRKQAAALSSNAPLAREWIVKSEPAAEAMEVRLAA